MLGGLALFALSMGMGAPLIAIGTSAGKLLPRAGVWMDAVKAVFGVMLLGVAIWMLEPGGVRKHLIAVLLLIGGLLAVYVCWGLSIQPTSVFIEGGTLVVTDGRIVRGVDKLFLGSSALGSFFLHFLNDCRLLHHLLRRGIAGRRMRPASPTVDTVMRRAPMFRPHSALMMRRA